MKKTLLMHYPFCLLLLLLSCSACQSQPPLQAYLGGWSGELPATDAFTFALRLHQAAEDSYRIAFEGKSQTITLPLEAEANGDLVARFGDQLALYLRFIDGAPIAFIATGNHLTYVDLAPAAGNGWSGTWNLMTSQEFDPTFYLSLAQNEDTDIYASTFFQSPVCHYMFGVNFKQAKESFTFTDAQSGIHFTGQLLPEQIELRMTFLREQLTFSLRRKDFAEWAIGDPDTGAGFPHHTVIDHPDFSELTDAVLADTLERTHAILIRQAGETLFEQYFDGFDQDTPHDTRSAAKSFASSLAGIAIREGWLPGIRQPIKEYLGTDYPDVDWSAGKADITIYDLMTMSSGLDAIDFGLNRTSYANEGNYQSQEDWTQYILSAPMINTPGAHANYGSGNPYLLGTILAKRAPLPLPYVLHQQLFGPLGFRHYRLQVDDRGRPYFGGGWYHTARDLATFGQLYLDGGTWRGQQLLPADWVRQSTQQHLVLENTFDQNPYGFYFWHKTYEVAGKAFASVEARGNGGQYVFLLPSHDLVVVILSGNFGNNKTFQPERIMQEYILPKIK